MEMGVEIDAAPSDRISAIRKICYGDLCSDTELAAALSLSVRTVHRYIARGMPMVKIGRRRYFEPEASAAWLRENCRTTKVPAPAKPYPHSTAVAGLLPAHS